MRTIRELREERGWSQFQLAVRASVTPGTIRNWERGKTEPKATQLRRLAEVFGLQMEEIRIIEKPESEEGKAAA